MLVLLFTLEEQARNARTTCSAPDYEALLAGIAQGDRESFEHFYRATDQMLYAYALSLTRNHHDAQDIMMDAYLKIRSSAYQYRPMGKPLAWIFTLTKNIARSKLRTLGRELAWEEVPDQEEVRSSFEAREDALVLHTALRILGQEERQIVLLHAVSGLKHREIAQLLSLPLSTVLSKYTRALTKLKRQLSPHEEVTC